VGVVERFNPVTHQTTKLQAVNNYVYENIALRTIAKVPHDALLSSSRQCGPNRNVYLCVGRALLQTPAGAAIKAKDREEIVPGAINNLRMQGAYHRCNIQGYV
jgi:hypothetical protein